MYRDWIKMWRGAMVEDMRFEFRTFKLWMLLQVMAYIALDDAIHPERAAERVRYEERLAARIAEYERTHPFKCSHPHCRDRFKSKGALTRHERHYCSWFKYDHERK